MHPSHSIGITDVEIEILEKYYPEYGFSKVQEFLPYLSRRQIVGKANRLNIHLENYGSNFWSVKEENILKKYYPLEGIHCKKRLPNKTENQVRHKANDLNIYRQYVWDADRLSVLQEYFPKGGYKLVYEKLNGEVSVEYIRGKARELGLKYSDSRWWTPEEDEIIIKYYPTMGCKVNCYLPNRSNSGIMNRAKKLNITYNKNK